MTVDSVVPAGAATLSYWGVYVLGLNCIGYSNTCPHKTRRVTLTDTLKNLRLFTLSNLTPSLLLSQIPICLVGALKRSHNLFESHKSFSVVRLIVQFSTSSTIPLMEMWFLRLWVSRIKLNYKVLNLQYLLAISCASPLGHHLSHILMQGFHNECSINNSCHLLFAKNSTHLQFTGNNKPIFVNGLIMMLLQIDTAHSDSLCQFIKFL